MERFEPQGRESVDGPESTEQKTLTVEEATNAIFWSYYYSQGAGKAQEHIFAYIARKHPDWKIAQNDAEEITKGVTERTGAYVRGAPHIKRPTEHSINQDASARSAEFIDALNNRTVPILDENDAIIYTPVEDVTDRMLLYEILMRDNHFTGTILSQILLSGRASRPNRDEKSKGHLRKRISHFAAYAIGGEKTPGPPVFKEMMDDLRLEYLRLKGEDQHSHRDQMILKWGAEMIEYQKREIAQREK